MGYEIVDWVKLAWDSIQLWAFVNTLMDLLVSIKGSDILDAQLLSAFK
jgi:hypothetical protein